MITEENASAISLKDVRVRRSSLEMKGGEVQRREGMPVSSSCKVSETRGTLSGGWKRSKVMSTKLRVRSRTKITKNNVFSIGTWDM